MLRQVIEGFIIVLAVAFDVVDVYKRQCMPCVVRMGRVNPR